MGQYGSASGGSLSASFESYALDAGQRVAAERDGFGAIPGAPAARRDSAASSPNVRHVVLPKTLAANL